MSLTTTETFEEFRHRVSLYQSGWKLRCVAVLAMWLLGYVGLVLNEKAIFGDDNVPNVPNVPTFRFFAGALFTALILVWPMVAVRIYVRRRCRRFGLVCVHCDRMLMYTKRNWLEHIREAGSCPSCRGELFTSQEVSA